MSATQGTADERQRERSRPRAAAILKAWALILVWILLIAAFSAAEPTKFFTHANLANILTNQAVAVIISLALLLPMTSGDFDLSIASNAGLSAMIVATLNVQHHVSIVLCIVIVLLAGAVIGAANGLIITVLRVDAFITTLGVGTLLSGITLAISSSNTVVGVDSRLTSVVDGSWFGISHCFYAALVLTAILWYVLDHTMAGRRALFVGLNPTVARLSGVRVDRVRVGALIASGVLSSLGGVAYVGTIGAADPTSSSSFLLPAFAACFLGATTIAPGRFNAWGTTAAAYFLATGFTGLELLGVQDWVQQVFYGGILIVAVALASGGLGALRTRFTRGRKSGIDSALPTRPATDGAGPVAAGAAMPPDGAS
jgi:ribose transport system permease protein